MKSKKVSWMGDGELLDKHRLNMELLHAASERDSEKLASLLASGAYPNVLDDHGNSSLHLALTLSCTCPTCIESAESCCAALLDVPDIDVNISNTEGQTPLHLASLNRLGQCVRSLISKGAYSYTSIDADIIVIAGENPGFDISTEEDCHNTRDFALNKDMGLLEAAATRDPDIIVDVLKRGADPDIQDSDGNTPLHLVLNLGCSCDACARNAQSCCAVLLNSSRINVNIQNKNGETPLHLAALNQLEKCADDLIFKGADCYIISNNGNAAMVLIATNIPKLMCKILDESILTTNGHQKKENCVIKIDFRPIILSKKVAFKKMDTKTNQKESLCNELKLLNSVLSSDVEAQKEIFLHPVVGIFLNQKWLRARIHLITSVIVRLIWLLFFTGYIILVYLTKCPLISKGNNVSLLGQLTVETSYSAKTTINGRQLTLEQVECLKASDFSVDFFLTCVLTIWRLVFNIMELYFAKRVHLRDIYHIIVMCMVLGTFYPTFFRQIDISPYQYQYAALTVFLAWSMNMTLFGKFRRIGGYLEMFGHVLWRFLTILPTFIFLFVAFAFAFCIMFPSKRFFDFFPFAIIRVLLMTVEIDYETMFYGMDQDLQSHGPIVGHLLYVVFVIVISIVLLNLIIGLTVSDIQNLQKEAQLKQIKVQVAEMYNMECIVYSWKLPNFIRQFLRRTLSIASKLERGDSNQLYFSFKINDPKDTSVPEELKLKAKPLVKRVHNERKARICQPKAHYELDRSAPHNLILANGSTNTVVVDCEN